jgi:uncharacterized protein YkwD
VRASTLFTAAVLAAVCALPAAAGASRSQALLTEVNAARGQFGQAPLAADRALSRAARRHAGRMARDGFFSHVDPGGRDVFDRARAVRWYGLRREGWSLHELLCQATGAFDNAGYVVGAWLLSPPHREGLLDPQASRAGLGVVAGRWVLITADPGTRRRS